MHTIVLKSGTWLAGLTRPFLASRSAVEAAIQAALVPQSLGRGTPTISKFDWHERKQQQPPVNPRLDPGYRDDWDEWFSVDYQGPELSFLVPESLSWLLSLEGAAANKPPAPAPAPAGDGNGIALLLLLLLLSKRT